MRGIGKFKSPEDRAAYAELYDAAMRQGPPPDKQLDIETTFGTTRVYRYGHVDKRPIVLLPGLAGTAACWATLVADLSREHPVYTVDTMGEPGMSTQTAPLRDHADRARWLDETLCDLELTDVHLVGGSTGGFYALQQAIHAPTRLSSVTLVDGTTVTAGFAPTVLGLGLLATVVNRDPLWRRFLTSSAGADVLNWPEVRLILAGIKHFRARLPPQVRPRADVVAAVELPMLALFAGRSTVHNATRAASRLRRLLPHAEIELWPETGHLMWLEEQDRMRIIERILAHS